MRHGPRSGGTAAAVTDGFNGKRRQRRGDTKVAIGRVTETKRPRLVATERVPWAAVPSLWNSWIVPPSLLECGESARHCCCGVRPNNGGRSVFERWRDYQLREIQ